VPVLRPGLLTFRGSFRCAFPATFPTAHSNGTRRVIDTQGTFLLSSPVFAAHYPRPPHQSANPCPLADFSLTPVFATHPKTQDLKSFVCHTSENRGVSQGVIIINYKSGPGQGLPPSFVPWRAPDEVCEPRLPRALSGSPIGKGLSRLPRASRGPCRGLPRRPRASRGLGAGIPVETLPLSHVTCLSAWTGLPRTATPPFPSPTCR
jgi:hypothetical protein